MFFPHGLKTKPINAHSSFDPLTTDQRREAHSKMSHLVSLWECLHASASLRLPSTRLFALRSPCCAHRWYWHMAATFAVFANLALLLRCLSSHSPPVCTQLCVNVTLPQSFLLCAADAEFDQLRCQWNITQIQHNNKSKPRRVLCCTKIQAVLSSTFRPACSLKRNVHSPWQIENLTYCF